MATSPEEALQNIRRVIVVSNVLPVDLYSDKKTGRWKADFDTDRMFEDGPILTGISNSIPNAVFVGVPPVNVPPRDRDIVEGVLARKNCYPVYVGAKEASLHYQGFCKSVLWPVFHNVIDLYNEVQIETVLGKMEASRPQTPQIPNDESESWHPARSFNPQEIDILWPAHMDLMMKFRSVIISLYSEGDLIWIQDYHLIMLVGPLRRMLPVAAPIGIFLHTPFPSSEIFRCVSKRNDVLESILQADHVGFHSYEYARHFLTCSQRMLGYAYGAQRGGVFGIKTGKGRTVTLTTTHAGLDMKSINQRLSSELPQVTLFPKSSPGTIVVCGVDEIEGLRGLALKMLAFDRLLVNVPGVRGRIVLKQVGINLDSRPHDFKRCLEEINRLVHQLNEKWGPGTVFFEVVTRFSLEDRLALYADSDVLLQTCVRWGLSMDALEFVAANRARAREAARVSDPSRKPRGPGVAVISEFVSSSRVLSGSLKINPWSIEETAKTLEKAVTMKLEERTARCFRDLSFVERTTINTWTRCILSDIAFCSAKRETQLMSYGLGVGMRAVGVGEGKLQRLDLSQFTETFSESKNIRLLAFDYSGTLVATTPADVFLKSGGQARSWHYSQESQGSEHNRLNGGSLETRDPVSPEVVQSLRVLASDPRNRIVIMSMDLRDELLYALKDIPNLILVAENGYATYLNQEWRQLVEEDDAGGDWYGGQSENDGMDMWQKDVKSVIDTYVIRTSGAFTFTAPSSVTFNYLLADPELGEHQSKSLALQLEARISGLPLVLELGKGTLTVRNRAVNRGAVLTQLLKLLPEPCDFLACFGDDVEDELMFRAAIDSKISNVFTCRVGVKGASEETRANYYLDDESDIAELLDKLCEDTDSPRPLPLSVGAGGMSSGGPSQKPMTSNRNSFAMLPGGFVTKKSLLSLSTLTEEGDTSHVSGSPSSVPRKRDRLGIPHTPSMGTFEDLLPAPTSIPSLVQSDDDQYSRSLKSTSLQPRDNNKKMTMPNSSAPSARPSPPLSSRPPLPKTSPPVSQEKQNVVAKEPHHDDGTQELMKLAGAAVAGAALASVVFLVASSLGAKKRL